jgi:hypothetical protein
MQVLGQIPMTVLTDGLRLLLQETDLLGGVRTVTGQTAALHGRVLYAPFHHAAVVALEAEAVRGLPEGGSCGSGVRVMASHALDTAL